MSSFEVGSILWVKCGALHWPAQIVDAATLDAEVQESLAEEKKQPEIILKFFNEDGYEFVHDLKTVFPYNGPRKEEFIKKGLVKSRSKIKEGATTGWFAKFPKDIVLCEEILNGDVHILEKEPYVEKNERPNYRAIFGSGEENSPKKKTGNQPGSGTRGRKRKAGADAAQSSQSAPPPKRAIVHPRFKGGRSDHNVKILTQPSSPYHMDLIKSPGSDGGTPTSTNANKYNCQICGFSASRLNVIILHNKTHSDTSGAPASPPKAAKTTPKSSHSVASSDLISIKSLLTPIIPPKGKPGRPKGSGKKKPGTPATPAAATPETPKGRGRGRPPRVKKVEEPDVKPPIVKTPKTASPVKKSRLTKKEKEELAKEEARKKAERDKILGDWDDDEEEEEKKVLPEKTRMRDLMEPFVDSSEEEEEEGFMGDDNVHGNSYEGEEEQDKKDREMEDARLQKEKEEKEKIEAVKSEPNDKVSESKANGEQNGSLRKSVDSKGDDELLAMDIGKVLEETAVPDVPSVDVEKVKKRKSVSFGATKEFANTKIALVQPESNLDDPVMIDDEFDEFVSSADISMPSPPTVYQAKKILKRGAEVNPVSTPSVALPSEEAVSKEGSSEPSPPTNGSGSNTGPQDTGEGDEVDQSKADSSNREQSVPSNEEQNQLESQAASVVVSEPEISTSESQNETASHPISDASIEEQKEEDSPETKTDLSSASEPSSSVPEPTQPDSNGQESAPLSNGTSLESQGEEQMAVSLSNETNTVSAVQMVMTTSDMISENGPGETTYVSQIPATAMITAGSAINVMTTVGGESASVVTSGEDTYLILVDDGSGAVDSLNSQTLYIDPSQLENGNMVLMTNEGVPVSAQGVSVASSNSTNHPHEILAALNTQQLQLQQQHQQEEQQQVLKTPVLGGGGGGGVKLGVVETTPSPTSRPVMSPAEIPSNSVALSNNTPVISEQQQQEAQQQQALQVNTVTQDQVMPWVSAFPFVCPFIDWSSANGFDIPNFLPMNDHPANHGFCNF